MTKAEQFRDLACGPKSEAGLVPHAAKIVVEGLPRWSSPSVRITFDDGSVATFPITKNADLSERFPDLSRFPRFEHEFPPGFFGTGSTGL